MLIEGKKDQEVPMIKLVGPQKYYHLRISNVENRWSRQTLLAIPPHTDTTET